VGKVIKKQIDGEEAEVFEGFRYSRYRNTSHSEWLEMFHAQIRNHEASSQEKLDLV